MIRGFWYKEPLCDLSEVGFDWGGAFPGFHPGLMSLIPPGRNPHLGEVQDISPGSRRAASNTPGPNTPGPNGPKKFPHLGEVQDISPGSRRAASNTPGPNTPGPNTPGPNTPGPNTPGPNTPGPNTPGPNGPKKFPHLGEVLDISPGL
jgi:hypothetical protein